jgi:predicted permease
VRQDLRDAFRTLVARPGFAVVAVVSLALGIGANTAIFSLWNTVSLASLPGVEDPESLVVLTNPDTTGLWQGRWNTAEDGPRNWITYDEFEHLQERAASFTAVMASQSSLNTWDIRVDGGVEEEARGRLVSGRFFEVLGAHPAAGRLFTSAEDRGEPLLAVISHAYWQRRFGGRADVIGAPLAFPTATLTIIGVAPAGFIGESAGQLPDVWLPIRLQPLLSPGRSWLRDQAPEKVMWLHAFGRLRPGVSITEAQAEVDVLFQASLESFYGTLPVESRREILDQHLRLSPGGRGVSSTIGQFASSVSILFGAVAILLLIGCANLANLLLNHGVARQGEIAVRMSLGASRQRIVRQLLVESLALTAVGGGVAIGVAYVMHALLVQLLQQAESTVALTFALDVPATLFVAGACVVTAVTVGAIPALQLTNGRSAARLQDISRGAIGSPRESRTSGWLVGVQLALSLPLLVAAGLLVRTAYNLHHPDLGFRPDRLLLARVNFGSITDDARRDRAINQFQTRIQALPGVQAVTFSQNGLFSGGVSTDGIRVESSPVTSEGARPSDFDRVGANYFAALGIPLRLGRDISEGDVATAPAVCVVNEAFVRRFLPGGKPVGRHVTLGDGTSGTAYRIVGVAADARTQSLRDDVAARFFVPAQQRRSSNTSRTFLIRVRSAEATIATAVRAEVKLVDPALSVDEIRPLASQLAELTAEDQAVARLALAFGLCALALCTVGLYGVLSYRVNRRASEIAIRVALGAAPSRVIAMILREAALVVLLGVAVGGWLSLAASSLLSARLYGVAPQDLSIFAAAFGVLAIAAFVAAYVPARRAARLDPMRVLHQS